MINHSRGPGNPSRASVTRTNARSQMIGPLDPSLMVARVQALLGSRRSKSSTRSGVVVGVLSRFLLGLRPLPDQGGTITAGTRRHINWSQLTSEKYHLPKASTASRKAGEL